MASDESAADDSLRAMQAQLRAFNEARDWGQYHSPRNLAMALNVEAGELLELYLWCRDDGPQPMVEARESQVADEAADVLICLLNLCDRAGVDLASAFASKLARNGARYPADQVRGRALKYSEYGAPEPAKDASVEEPPTGST